ncbi:S8 family peptidase [Mangrovimonas sp. DI 80]|uniref:S8 family peptidase n=1 Tax=Mangrovimonas sp. DI 80 TaxID=1779330 RepID=UPI00097778DA|nr:S8 family peptidase [Mangrovimonas sp. DI 80]OMP31052.1 hypothetical protein BKM32_08245 [Mangrovimonas sp. DI 80]
MELKSIIKYSIMGTLGLTIFNCQPDATDQVDEEIETVSFMESKVIPGSYIVVYNNANQRMAPLPKVKTLQEYTSQMNGLKRLFLNEFETIGLEDSHITATFGHAVKGFAANLSEAQLQNLQNDPRVLRIEQNFTMSISPYKGKPGGGNTGTSDTQQIPYGTTRVGGGNTASSHTAWIIDSGIDLDHPDLNVDVSRSVSFLSGSGANSADDQNGHGTHVAGTIAALDNNIGSVGVAPGTTVVAVRVLDRRGSGSLSGVIAGVDYVKAEGEAGDVANMSLGGGVSQILDNAVIAAAAESGVKFVLAAGNESNNANSHSPARANGANIYTISAMDSDDNWAYFSNYGNPPVDYCAPGVGVYSTWKNGGYNSISGTSMAAPHAAGVLLLGNPSTDGTVNGDPDGNADAIIHL